MKGSTKLYVAALTLIALFAPPNFSSAQSVADLQAQIQALLAQVQALQVQLQQIQGQTTTQWCHDFSVNLSVGSSGSEVTALQTALQKETINVSLSGAFDETTASAVTGFQEKYRNEILTPNDLQYGTGYVGKFTRVKLNALYSCLITPTSSISPLTPSFTFTKALSLGSEGNEVRELQVLLNEEQLFPRSSINGSFDFKTMAALERFQEKYGIVSQGLPGYGTVGPKTRKQLNLIHKTYELQALPFSVTLTTSPHTSSTNKVGFEAQVTGATGNLTYTFYCNRNDQGLDIVSGWKLQVTSDQNPKNLGVCVYPGPGAYTAKVIVQANEKTQEARIGVEVTSDQTPQATLPPSSSGGGGAPPPTSPSPQADTTPPTASITSPVGGTTVSNTVSIAASASDNVGVTKVELYVNGVLLGTDTTSPYNFSWNTANYANVLHTLQVKAYDAAGNITFASVIMVTVSNAVSDEGGGGASAPPPPGDTTPPSVSITSPQANQTVSGAITLSATASDNVGVTSVQFQVDGQPIATVSQPPYQTNWDTTKATNANHTITAIASDAAGNTQSVSVSVVASNQVVFTCEATGASHCYYVAPDGNDANPGTFNAPFKTFKPALVAANPGDFIYARGGTYGMDNAMVTSVGVDGSIAPGTPNCAPGERFVDNHCCYDSYALISIKDFSGYASTYPAYSVRNGAAGNPITAKAYPGESIFFAAPSSGGKPLNQKACSGSVNPYCSYNGFTYPSTLASFVSVVRKSYWVIQGFDMNGSYLTGSAVVYIGGGNSVPGETHDIIVQNNNIHDYVSWNGSGNNVGLIKIDRGDTGGPWNIFIRNNQLHDASDPSAIGQWTGVSDAQHYGTVTTLSREYYLGYDGGGTGYIEIAGNTIYHMPHLFMFKNPMYGPVEMHNNVMYDSDALGALNTANLHMVHNLIYGVPLSWNPTGGGYGTAITDPRLLGITGQNAIIKNNTFVGLNELMVIGAGTGHNIQNNIYFGLTARVAGAGWDTPAYIKKLTSPADPIAPSSSILKQITSDNNCFITPYTDFQFVQRFLTINSSTVIEHYSYDQAKTAFGFDANSKVIIQSDPAQIFVDPANHNYNLLNSSQCPGMGYYAYAGPSASGNISISPSLSNSLANLLNSLQAVLEKIKILGL